jgi:hypothetical protein
MNDSIVNNDAIGLLEECIANGKSGKDTLYAWFLEEQVLIDSTIRELMIEEKGLEIKPPEWPEGPEKVDEGRVY